MNGFTQKRVRELFHYNPWTGFLTWRVRQNGPRRWNTRYAGTVVKSKDKDGYVIVHVDGKRKFAHRVIWLYVYGYLPVEVDHDDHDRANNRIDNLSDVSHLTNMKNRSLPKNNKSGRIGVYFYKPAGKWRAKIRVGERYIELGLHSSFDDACRAREVAELRYGFNDNHGLRISA